MAALNNSCNLLLWCQSTLTWILFTWEPRRRWSNFWAPDRKTTEASFLQSSSLPSYATSLSLSWHLEWGNQSTVLTESSSSLISLSPQIPGPRGTAFPRLPLGHDFPPTAKPNALQDCLSWVEEESSLCHRAPYDSGIPVEHLIS